MNKFELIEQLRKTEETLLLELLDISSEELVDAFLDKIDEKLTYLYEQVGEEEEL